MVILIICYLTHICVRYNMKRRELEKKLLTMKWKLVRHGRRHDIWSNGDDDVAVPRHREINEYTARAILREAEGEK